MTQLIGRYERPLYRFLLRISGDAHLAEDLFQETFLRLHRARADFRSGMPLKPYLYRIALNAFRDARSAQHRPNASLDAPTPGTAAEPANGPATLHDRVPSGTGEPSAAAEQGELHAQVRRAVESLPQAEREVVLLRVFEGLSFSEIATVTGVPLPTAKSRMLYALRRLRPVLEKYLSGGGSNSPRSHGETEEK